MTMVRVYKLAANFNTVEFSIGPDVSEDEIPAILQKEYDFLANIKTVSPVPTTGKTKSEDVEPPTEKQIEVMKRFGLKVTKGMSKEDARKAISASIEAFKNNSQI